MLKELRLQHGLTQQEVADSIGRSPNYVLKAEQLTFPTAPASLVQFYLNLDDSLSADFLRSWYNDEQRKTREAWLSEWLPFWGDNIGGFSFIHAWISTDQVNLEDRLVPTEYAVSKGLCLPAAVVYHLQKDKPAVGGIVFTVLDQLVEYVRSGRYAPFVDLDSLAHPHNVLINLGWIRKELEVLA